MAHALTHTQTDLGHGLSGLIARIRKSLKDYRLYQNTLQELRMLSDRELDDLGISKHVIAEVAYDAVYGR